MSPLHWLLVASLLGNAVAGWAYLGQRDAATTAQADLSAKRQELAGVRGAAEACSTAVGELRTIADQRLLDADAARRVARSRAAEHNRRADEILAAPPPVPGDACASAQTRVDTWLRGRTLP